MTGFVSFVGSGPGDPELLTLKAVDRLKRADAVLFDDLSVGADPGPCPDRARISSASASAPGGLAPAAPCQPAAGRLRAVEPAGGAAEIRRRRAFGRLEEELVALRAAGIPFEIVPGVPSACAAAAAAGIPLTRRLTARRVQFVTGHDVTGQLPEDINLAALADPGAATVVFMGKRTFPRLLAALTARGLPPDTPAILAEGISGPDQRIERTTVAALAQRLEREVGDKPALILYGPLAEF